MHKKINKMLQIGVEIEPVPVGDMVSEYQKRLFGEFFAVFVKRQFMVELKQYAENKLKQKII